MSSHVQGSTIDAPLEIAPELALRQAEEELRLAFDHAPVGMAIVDLQGHYMQVNRALCEITGYTAAEMMHLRFHDITHRDDLAADLELVDQLVRREIPRYQLAKRYIRKDGSIADIRLHGSLVLDERGAPRHFIAHIEDMTERNQLERRLQLADRLASLGTFAAGVAHEVNNPLAYLMANLELAREHVGRLHAASPSLDLGELDELVREASEGAERVRKIVRGLKTFSHFDDDPLAPQDLTRVIELAIGLAAGTIERAARMVTELGPAPRVDANEAQLAKALIHLFINAAQAIPEGAAARNVIGVRTSTDDAGNAVIEVWDTGAGIARQYLSRVFDPFFTTRPIGQGTGMGLAICHGIITALHGKITVDSELGKGTRFRIVLPPSAQ